MSRKNYVGALSLAAANAGFAVMETLRHFSIAATPAWSILQSGFEAGMMGGCADWFAVSALFRPIPTPRFCLPHTNIIVRSREKLSAGIVDMVQNRWLSPETLAEHLDCLSASSFILEHLFTKPWVTRQFLGQCPLSMRHVESPESPIATGWFHVRLLKVRKPLTGRMLLFVAHRKSSKGRARWQ